MKNKKIGILCMLPIFWMLTNGSPVLAEEVVLDQDALASELTVSNNDTESNVVVLAEEETQLESAPAVNLEFLAESPAEQPDEAEDYQQPEETMVASERLEHTIEANAPPTSEDAVAEEENEQNFAEEENETQSDEEPNQKPQPEESNESDEELIAIIVETKNEAALNRTPYRDRPAFEVAVEQATHDVNVQYEAIKSQLAERGYNLEARHQYSASFTGFSAEVPRWVAEELKNFQQVASISKQQKIEAPVYQPNMNSSPGMIDLVKMYEHDLPYKGAGMVVSVIDTGIDPDHPDFVLDDDVEMRYTQESMNQKIEELGLKGRWYSNKIPYGYNYIDRVQTVKDRNEHGIHVAGTIGANGNPELGGLRGVAPHVQILAMKAFSNDPSFQGVYEDTWLKAFDDSIKLGADVINLSLGGTAGFYFGGTKPSASAFQLARSKGIIPVVANGNDRNQAYGNEWKAHKDNPDNLMTGSPALIEDSFAVASVDNVKQMVSYVEVTYGDNQVERFEGTSVDPFLYTEEAYPLVEAGLGRNQDYPEGISLENNYVIVQRGQSTFADKYAEAAKRGARGILVYDNVDSESLMRMGGVDQPRVPMIMLLKESGERILQLKDQYDNLQVRIPKGMMQKETPTGNNISEFSSWGPTNDLRLKPEIAAPGGNIYSLMSDGRYQDKSGTSMATPHMSGVAALVMERLIKEGYITEETMDVKDDLAILMMMNTATPLVNTLGNSKYYYSPIQQGAGLVNVYNAVTNEVVVTATGGRDIKEDGKLELGDKIGSTFDFELTLHNLGQTRRTYQVEGELIRDLFDENNRFTEETTYAQIHWLGEAVVEPGQTVRYRFTMPTFRIENNQYIHGYIHLHSDQPEEVPSLSVPVLGFKGEWDQLPIIDKIASFSPREELNIKPISLGNLSDGTEVFADTGFTRSPYNPQRLWGYWNAWNTDLDRTVFANPKPNNDYVSEVRPLLSFLRDAVDVDYVIEDANGDKVRHLNNRRQVVKVNRLYISATNYLQAQPAWDFIDADGDLVEDGIYRYVITGRIDDPTANYQRHAYTVVVDQTPVEIQSRYEGNQLTLNLSDNVAGLDYYAVLSSDGSQILYFVEVDKETNPRLLAEELLYTVPADFEGQDFIVVAVDNSGNQTVHFVTMPVEEEEEEADPNEQWLVNQEVNSDDYTFEDGILTSEMPFITIEVPSILAAYDLTTEQINISGQITNFSEVHRIEYYFENYAGELIATDTLDAVLYLDDETGAYYFNGVIDMSDKKVSDLYRVSVRAHVKSPLNNLVKHQVSRPIYVDYDRPTLEVRQVYGPNDNRVYFEIEFADNMPYVQVMRDNDYVARLDNTYNTLAPIAVSGTKRYDFRLKPGKTQALFVATDIVGNTTERWIDLVANYLLAPVGEEPTDPTPGEGEEEEPSPSPEEGGKEETPTPAPGEEEPTDPTPGEDEGEEPSPSPEEGGEEETPTPEPGEEEPIDPTPGEGEVEEPAPTPGEGGEETPEPEPGEEKPTDPTPGEDEVEEPAPAPTPEEGTEEETPTPQPGEDESTDLAPDEDEVEDPTPTPEEGSEETSTPSPEEDDNESTSPEQCEEQPAEPAPGEGEVEETTPDPEEGEEETPTPEQGEEQPNEEATAKTYVDNKTGVAVALSGADSQRVAEVVVVQLTDVTLEDDLLDDYEVEYYDIFLLNAAGELVQLTQPARVTLPNREGLEMQGVYYIPAFDQAPEHIVNAKQLDQSGQVEFIADHFSIYAVAYYKQEGGSVSDNNQNDQSNTAKEDLENSVDNAKETIEESNSKPFSPANKIEELEKKIESAEDLLTDSNASQDALNEAKAELDSLANQINQASRPSTPVYYPNAADKSSAIGTLPATGEMDINLLLSLLALMLFAIASFLLKAGLN